jgi:alkanesulfonate monooxygenase SsuD/methylene tetrahydromethanopterin reductase-like flavin-dependent oxidoreductase (luciferase family)
MQPERRHDGGLHVAQPLSGALELAEIDLISRGRLVTGWVRGAGSEQFFNNANPAYNREMFNEAHDFIVQAWTRPGPNTRYREYTESIHDTGPTQR